MTAPNDQPANTTGAPASTRRRRGATAVLILWALIVIALSATLHLCRWDGPFAESYAWFESHVGLMARHFHEQGVLATWGVPLQNHPPHGDPPDTYTHWPPLLQITLGFAFDLFGDNDATVRVLMYVILLCTASGIGFIARQCCGWLAALIAVVTFLCMPMVSSFAGRALYENMAIMWMVWSIAWLVHATAAPSGRRLSLVLGAVCASASVASSWQPAMAYPGIVLAGMLIRDRRVVRCGVLYLLVAGVTGAAVLALYAGVFPHSMGPLFTALVHRLGLTPELPIIGQHGVAPDEPTVISFTLSSFVTTSIERAYRFGAIAIIATTVILFRAVQLNFRQANPRIVIAITSLLTCFVLWCAVMNNHALIHDYIILLAAAPCAISVGVVASHLATLFDSQPRHAGRAGYAAIALAVPALMAGNLFDQTRDVWHVRDRGHALAYFGHDVRDVTDEGSVVFMHEESYIPVYYSKRHVIRLVCDDQDVAEALDIVRRLYPDGVPRLYLAFPPDWRNRYPQSLKQYPVVAENDRAIVLELAVPERS